MRHDTLRRLHRPYGRPTGEVVHGVRRPGKRQGDHDGRGPGAGRQAPSAPGRLHGGARSPVRLLHARHADDQLRLPQETSGAERRRHPLGHLRQPLPVHRLREHRQGGPVRGGQAPARRRVMALRTSSDVGGMGHSIKRKEDPRFIRGKGTYVDDLQLPGMLYLDIVRSPYAHAKIKKIDTAKALAVPGVLAVITGQDLAKYNLHWMPTLMSDTQMVLPVEKVMYQAQEVAAVLATSRYAAADGMAAVEVQYEPLPVVVDPRKALEPGAPVLRTDKKDKKDNPIGHWEWGDRAATDRAFAAADVTVKQDIKGSVGGGPIAPLPEPDVIVLFVLLVGAQHRGAGLERLSRVHDDGQRLVLHLHRRHAVGRRVAAPGRAPRHPPGPGHSLLHPEA